MPVYVQNHGGLNETAATHRFGDNYTMDECLGAMEDLCPDVRGLSFECMACADRQRGAVMHNCGNYSDGDSPRGWGIHFYCGIGWPGSSFQRSPVTQYCVEHAMAPQTDPIPGGDGYSQYVYQGSIVYARDLLKTVLRIIKGQLLLPEKMRFESTKISPYVFLNFSVIMT